MALPQVTGRGFLISDGVELKYSAAGNAWARLPLVFKNQRKENDQWVHDKEILVEAMVFGATAEFLADAMDGRGDIVVTGDLYSEKWTNKQGEEVMSIKMNVTAASPVKARERVAAAPAPASDPWGSAEDAPPF